MYMYKVFVIRVRVFIDVVVDKCGPVYTRESSSELINVLCVVM